MNFRSINIREIRILEYVRASKVNYIFLIFELLDQNFGYDK